MKENTNDPLLWFFTSLVSLFPAIILTAFLFVFYLVISFVLSKNHIVKTDDKKGLIYSVIAGIFAILSVIVCVKWEFWSSINMLIPYAITGLMFNRRAKKHKGSSKITTINVGIILTAVLIALISVFF